MNLIKISLKNFSTSKQVYRPLIPLTNKYNLIFNQQQFAKGKFVRPPSIFWYWIPAGAMMVNNFLTDWAWYKSLAFGTLLVGGMAFRSFTNDSQSLVIYSLQTDPQLKYVYLTVKKSPITELLAKQYPVKRQELKSFLNSYHPAKEDPREKGKQIEIDLAESAQKKSFNLFVSVQSIEAHVYRLKIPINDIKFQFEIQPEKKFQFERDLQRLTPKQMMRKYEKQPIHIKISQQDKKFQQLKYVIDGNLNNNKRYQDYLLAMALGYEIDTSNNRVKQEQEQKSQVNP